MVPFLYISLACAHALARPSSLAHLNFPLSISLSSAYKVGANNRWTGESFGYEKRAAKWLELFRALHTFEEELTYYGSLLVRLRILQMKTTLKFQYKRKSRRNLG